MARPFILTNSIDSTSDLLVNLLGEERIDHFRWNVDLWHQYEISFTADGCRCSDPTGRIIDVSDPDVILLWRKPFIDLMDFASTPLETADQNHAKVQVGAWLSAVVAVASSRNQIRLVEPYADRRLPKLFQLLTASSYFQIPHFEFSIFSSEEHFRQTLVATKPLGDPSVGDGQIFYTQLVNKGNLYRPYPWFVQQAIIGGTDVTCVYIGGECHFFECSFCRTENTIDWRTEINTSFQSDWRKLSHANLNAWSNAVAGFMNRHRLHYGRLDFILKEDILYFLECNSNGQFGWLDTHENYPLHRQFLRAALNPAFSVI